MSVLRSAGVRSTVASFVEVTIFFCIISPLFFVLFYVGYHGIHGPLSRDNQAERLVEQMTAARQGTERLADQLRVGGQIIPESALGEALRQFQMAIGAVWEDPIPAIQQTDALQELIGREARRVADDLETAMEYAEDRAKQAAEAMLADVLESASRVSISADLTKANVDEMKTIGQEIIASHADAIKEAHAAVAQMDADMIDAQTRLTLAELALKENLTDEDRQVLRAARADADTRIDEAQSRIAAAKGAIRTAEDRTEEEKAETSTDEVITEAKQQIEDAKELIRKAERHVDLAKMPAAVAQGRAELLKAQQLKDQPTPESLPEDWVSPAVLVERKLGMLEGLQRRAGNEKSKASSDISRSETTKADALKLIEDLQPLPDVFTPAVEALQAAEKDGQAMAKTGKGLADSLNTLTTETTKATTDAAVEGVFLEDVLIENRRIAAQKLRSETPKLIESTQAIATQAAAAAEVSGRTYQRILDALGDRATAFSWNLRRGEVSAQKLLRRNQRARQTAEDAQRAVVEPGQSFGASINQGLGDIQMDRICHSRFPFLRLGGLFASLPWWLWVVAGLLYLWLIVAYWSPGDQGINTCEVRGFSLFMAAAAIVAVIACWSGIVEQFLVFCRLTTGG